jgi:hypothetical protein
MADMLTSTCATVASVGMPPRISRADAGACMTPAVRERQAYLKRRVTMTRNWAGTMSSRSETSSPMQCRQPPQAQVMLSGLMISSMRGRCLGMHHGWRHVVWWGAWQRDLRHPPRHD